MHHCLFIYLLCYNLWIDLGELVNTEYSMYLDILMDVQKTRDKSENAYLKV